MINGQVMDTDGRVQVVNKGRKYRLTINNALLTDAGDIIFTIKDLTCRTMLFVKGKYLALIGKSKQVNFGSEMHLLSFRKTRAHL